MFQEVLYLFSDGFMYRIDIERSVNDKEALRVFFRQAFRMPFLSFREKRVPLFRICPLMPIVLFS